jgi:hypothetical protein
MTKDSEKVLCYIYRDYLNKIKKGQSKTSARKFSSEFSSSCNSLTKWHPDDIDTAINELDHLGYLRTNILGEFQLTDDAVTHMENRFKNRIVEITDYISKFIP